MFLDSNWLEIPAVVLSLSYTYLAGRNSIVAWPVALVSSLIFIGISLETQLVQDILLHAFYAVSAVWGWIHWYRKRQDRKPGKLKIQWLVLALIITGLLAFLSYFLLNHLELGVMRLADACTTWFSFLGTFLIVYRYREGWLLFVAIDCLQAWIYGMLLLPLLSGLYIAYTLLALLAWKRWGNEMKVGSHEV